MPEKRLMKLDYNNLLRNINDILDNSRSKIIREEGWGVALGLNLLNKYMIKIAERALEINDEVLIGLLKDLCILKEDEDDKHD